MDKTELYGANDFRSYLSHHGILGQKWGIRRFQAYGEGGYNRKGGKTGKNIGEAKKQKKLASSINKNVSSGYYSKEQPKIKGLPAVKKLYSDLEEERKEVNDSLGLYRKYWALSEDQRDSYIRKAVDMQEPEDEEDWQDTYEYYKYDDGDQGEYSSYDLFCRDHGSTEEAEWDKYYTAKEKYDKKCEQITKQTLGEYADTPITKYTKSYSWSPDIKTAEDAVRVALDSMLNDEVNEEKK